MVGVRVRTSWPWHEPCSLLSFPGSLPRLACSAVAWLCQPGGVPQPRGFHLASPSCAGAGDSFASVVSGHLLPLLGTPAGVCRLTLPCVSSKFTNPPARSWCALPNRHSLWLILLSGHEQKFQPLLPIHAAPPSLHRPSTSTAHLMQHFLFYQHCSASTFLRPSSLTTLIGRLSSRKSFQEY